MATDAVAIASEYTDGNNVYYWFAGVTIYYMLKLQYNQIRSGSDDQ